MTPSRPIQRGLVSRPWALLILAVVTIGVFAVTWLNGQPLGIVGLATIATALLGWGILTLSNRFVGTPTFRVVAHLLLGLAVLAVALLYTLMGVAAGELTGSLQSVLILGSLWGLGGALVVAGILVAVAAGPPLRWVAWAGLAITVLWGAYVTVVLASLVVGLLTTGVNADLAWSISDDLGPVLVLFVSFVLLPLLVFRRDLREERRSTTHHSAGEAGERP